MNAKDRKTIGQSIANNFSNLVAGKLSDEDAATAILTHLVQMKGESVAELWPRILSNVLPHLDNEARFDAVMEFADFSGEDAAEFETALVEELNPEHAATVAALAQARGTIEKMRLGFAFYERFINQPTAALREFVEGEFRARTQEVGKAEEQLIQARMAELAAENAGLLLGDNDALLRSAVVNK